MKKTVISAIILTLFLSGHCAQADKSSRLFKPFRPFKFAVIADPHISDLKSDPSENSAKMYRLSADLLKDAVVEINKVDALDFTLVLGDVTRDAEPWNVKLFKKVMNKLTSPYYLVLGNHDVNSAAASFVEYQAGESRSYMIGEFQGQGFQGPGAHWSLDPLPHVHLIGLDTTIVGDWGGELSPEGIEFLNQDLAENKNKLTIVMLHHQLLPYTTAVRYGVNDFHKFMAYNSEQIRLILESSPQVVMTLSGHRHLSTRYIRENNIAYFTIPSTAVWPMRYVIFDVTPEQMNYATYDLYVDPDVRKEAKMRVLAEQITFSAGSSDPSDSYEADKELAEVILSEQTRVGAISLKYGESSQILP